MTLESLASNDGGGIGGVPPPRVDLPMNFSPMSGYSFKHDAKQYPSVYRDDNPTIVWHFNPWTGERRKPSEVEKDPKGLGIVEVTPRLAKID